MSAFHRVVPPNRRGRDFVVGDLHGYLGALQDALARAGFDPGCDRLFSTGDLIDRGARFLRQELRKGRLGSIEIAGRTYADFHGSVADLAVFDAFGVAQQPL